MINEYSTCTKLKYESNKSTNSNSSFVIALVFGFESRATFKNLGEFVHFYKNIFFLFTITKLNRIYENKIASYKTFL